MMSRQRLISIINVLAISFVAIFLKQVGHEVSHGVLAEMVGAKWTQLSLFYAEHVWPREISWWGETIITGGATIANIIAAFIGVWFFQHESLAQYVNLRLFLFFFTAYNIFAGFGYLFADPLMYQRGGENLSDWERIITMLGGGWEARIPILLIGAAGMLGGFFWVGQNAHVFIPAKQPARFQAALLLLLLPYFIWNGFFTLLAYLNPFKPIATSIAVQYWFGYFGIGWGAFMAGRWLSPRLHLIRSELSETLAINWILTALAMFLVTIFVLLTTIQIR